MIVASDTSRAKDAPPAKALAGDVQGALTDIGQASHTAQDIVRHDFESASQHGWSEAPATPAEMKAAVQATDDLIDQFTSQVYVQGIQDGMSFGDIAATMQNVLQVTDQANKTCQSGGNSPCQ